MCYNDLTNEENKTYHDYLSSHFDKVWHSCTQGFTVTPVITEKDINRLFGITIPNRYECFSGVQPHAFSIKCDAQGKYFDINQFESICYECRLKNYRNYGDVIAAWHLFKFNKGVTNILPWSKQDMYNALQLHNEFLYTANKFINDNSLFTTINCNFDININTINGDNIVYRELINYLHFGYTKPEIKFTVLHDTFSRKCLIEPDDYDAKFTDDSYNIVIRNVKVM